MADFTNYKNNLRYELKKLEKYKLNSAQMKDFIHLKFIVDGESNHSMINGGSKNDMNENLTLNKVKLMNESMMRKLSVACQEYSILWQILVEDHPKITKVAKALEKSAYVITECIDFWDKNPIFNSMNLPVKKLYSQFLIQILNRQQEGDKLYYSYVQKIKKYGMAVNENKDNKGNNMHGPGANGLEFSEDTLDNELSFIDLSD
jgi:hypothetical protein